MRANEFITEAWSQKYKNSINCSHPKGFSQRAHCAGKKKHNESVEMELVCEDCGMCQTHGNLNEIRKGEKDSNGYTRCWPGKHAEGTKTGRNGGQVRNCVPNESIEENEGKRCMQCGMINCKCPGDSCKCKPIAGWIPGKGFRKAMDEAANAARRQAAIAINMKKHHQKPKGVSEDLSRRGFLKGAGAAAVAGAAGGAKADRSWGQDEFTGKWKSTMNAENFNGAYLNVDQNRKLFRISLVTPINFTPANIQRGNLYYPKITSSKVGYKWGGYPAAYGQGKVGTSPAKQFGNYVYYYIDLFGDMSEKLFNDIWNVYLDSRNDKFIFQIEIDNEPTTLVFKVQESDLQQLRQQQPKESVNQGVAEGICSLEEAHAIFDDFEQAMAARGLTEDAFDTITDEDIIRETAAWRRSAGKSKKGGLNRKGVMSYRREHPGSHLQMAVTTKPSKLKPGSKAAKRRKSFCARMSGVKGPMKKPNGKPTRKALALRKWNC